MIRIRLKELLAEREFRERRVITLVEISEATGIHRTTLGKISNTVGYNCGLDALDRLCAYFGCRIEQLAEFIPEPTASPGQQPTLASEAGQGETGLHQTRVGEDDPFSGNPWPDPVLPGTDAWVCSGWTRPATCWPIMATVLDPMRSASRCRNSSNSSITAGCRSRRSSASVAKRPLRLDRRGTATRVPRWKS